MRVFEIDWLLMLIKKIVNRWITQNVCIVNIMGKMIIFKF